MLRPGRLTPDYLAAFWLMLLCAWLYRDAFNLWWTYDDPYLLASVVFDSFSGLFFDPDVYQSVSIFSFIPLFFLSFKIDYALFGFEPFWFYLHQVTGIFLVSLGVYVLGRRMDRRAALLGASLFLFSGPALAAGHILMLRHYLEGAVFSLAAVICIVYSGSNRRGLWAGALLYFMACLCKEVYLPLVIAVPFLLTGSWNERARKTLPFIFMLFLYTVWRFLMLPGAGVGPDMGPEGLRGYWPGWAVFAAGMDSILAAIWFMDQAHPLYTLFLVLMFVFAGLLVFLGARGGSKGLFAGLILMSLACAATILPRWTSISPENFLSLRLSFHLAVMLALAFVFVLSKAMNDKGRLNKAAFVFLALLVALGAFLRDDFRTGVLEENILVHSRNYEFYYEQPPSKTLVVNTLDHHWVDLQRLRRYHKGDHPPAVCYRPFDFREDGQPYYEYQPGRDFFSEVTEDFLKARDAYLEGLSGDVSFELEIEVDQGRLSIVTDMHDAQGRAYLLIGSRKDVFWGFVPISRHFSIAMARRDVQWVVRVMVRLEDGKASLSPYWTINLAEDAGICWSSSGS